MVSNTMLVTDPNTSSGFMIYGDTAGIKNIML